MPEAWPSELSPYSVGFWLENQSRGGGVAINGQEQVVDSVSARWRARYDIVIRNKSQILAVRALSAKLNGRVGEVLLPAFDGPRANWPIQVYAGNPIGIVLNPCTVRDKSLDGTSFEEPEIPAESEIIAKASGAAAIGLTTLSVKLTQGSPIQAGQFFSTADRLYLIQSVSNVGKIYTLNFKPRLRAAIVLNQPIFFSRPFCKMRFANDDQGLQMLQLRRFADLSFEFVEAL